MVFYPYANRLRHVWTPEGTLAVPGFRQDQDQFRDFRFSPDGNYLLVVASVGDYLIWDRPHGRLVQLSGPTSAAANELAWWSAQGSCWFHRPRYLWTTAEGDTAVLRSAATAVTSTKRGRHSTWGRERRRRPAYTAARW